MIAIGIAIRFVGKTPAKRRHAEAEAGVDPIRRQRAAICAPPEPGLATAQGQRRATRSERSTAEAQLGSELSAAAAGKEIDDAPHGPPALQGRSRTPNELHVVGLLEPEILQENA